MRAAADKTTSTYRLSRDVKDRLARVARHESNSESQIVEDALTEYFEKYGYNTSYVLNVTPQHIFLFQLEGRNQRLMSTEVRNGVTPGELQELYSKRLLSNVELVVTEEKGHG